MNCKNYAGTMVVAMAAIITATTMPAYALDKIYSPNVTKGELEFEYSGSTTFDRQPDKNNLQSHEAELEYGLTNRIMLELSGAFEKQPGESLKSNTVGLGGRYQFFEQGENWLDSGLLVSYGRATQSHDADAAEVKLLLEKDTGKITSRANIGFEQQVGHNAEGGADYVFLWSSRYRYNEHFQPGFEIQSDLGQHQIVRHFDQQEHYIGPALYGQIIPHLKYEAAYLFGASDAAAQGAARLLVEYEMYF